MIFLFDPELGKVRTWKHCEIEGLCFFVTIKCLHTGHQNRAAIINCAYELRLYLQTAKDVEILTVQMMCPPSISGVPEWTLEELESVVLHSGVDTDENAAVYRTKSRAYKLGELDLRRMKKSRILYSAHHHLDHKAEISGAKASDNEGYLYSNFCISQ